MTPCAPSGYQNSWLDLFQQRLQRASLEPKLFFGWKYDVSGEEVAHVMAVRNPETSLASEDAETLQLRVACHYLVDIIAGRGLMDVFECLKDNLAFYQDHVMEHQLPSKTGIRVKIGQKTERPVFHLAEE